ncbi:hypothetical protein VTP01DRAFT_449 [Rhizomucor pusillus]|uniref:uncharacterized protein n=1 Tax=Rhizomucor pusillus TaxID=4840 RepID=UPI003743F8C5
MVSTSFISVAILAIASVASAAPVSSQSDVLPGNGYHHGVNTTTFPGHGHHYSSGSHASYDRRCERSGSRNHHHKKHRKKPSHAKPTATKKATQQVPSTTTSAKHAGTSASTKKSFGSSSLSSEDAEVLKLHNEFRAKHSAPALEWSTKLAEYAQKWSDRCVFEHSQGPYGENLAMGYGSWTDAITAWYDEYKEYDYSNPGFSSATGHFTQLVWKGTTQLGCGVTKCLNGPLYTCSYYKPGNIVGGTYFQENVLPN